MVTSAPAIGNHFLASSLSKSRYLIKFKNLNVCSSKTVTTFCQHCKMSYSCDIDTASKLACTVKSKKFMLKPYPLTTYLFVTVIRMLAKQ